MADPSDDEGDEGRRDNGAGGPLARLFAVQLLAVVAITVVLTGIFALVKRGDDATTTALAQPTSSASATAGSAAPPSPAPSSAPPSTSVAPSPSASPSPTGSDNRPEVVVFNQDGPAGSEQDAAGRLRDTGWAVFKVDTFRGDVSTTTVYYPDGLAKQARAAAKVLPGTVRTKVKFSNLSDTRLTVIITSDYGQ